MKLSAHFDSREFACHCGPCQDGGIEPIVDPRLLEALELWRTRLNATRPFDMPEHAILINSGCRCAAWNSHEGGKPGSAHLYNPATGLAGRGADCRCPTLPLRGFYEAALTVDAFKGVGLSPDGDYVHVDVRPAQFRSQWGYSNDGLVVAINTVLPRIGIEPAARMVV